MKVKGSLYWIYSFISGCKGKMLVAILLAVIGVLCGMAPYFALAGILSGLIQNTLTAERIFCYVGIAVLGETLKMLFNTVSSLKAHRVAYHILGNIRCKLAEKMMRVPMGVMVDTPSGKLKAMVVDGAHQAPEGPGPARPLSVRLHLRQRQRPKSPDGQGPRLRGELEGGIQEQHRPASVWGCGNRQVLFRRLYCQRPA